MSVLFRRAMEWKTKLPKRSHTMNTFDLQGGPVNAVSTTSIGTSSSSLSLFWDDFEDTSGTSCTASASSSHRVTDVSSQSHTSCTAAASSSSHRVTDVSVPSRSVVIDGVDSGDDSPRPVSRKVFGQLRPPTSRSVHLTPIECVEVDASQDSDVQDVSARSPVLAPRAVRSGRSRHVREPALVTDRSRSPALVTRQPRPSVIARSDAQLAAEMQREEFLNLQTPDGSIGFGGAPPGRQWLYVVEPCARAAKCHGCNERIINRVPRVYFQHARHSKVSSAHVGCLAGIPGLIRPGSSAEVMVSSRFQPAERAAIEAQLSELPHDGHGRDICRFEWPPPVRVRPVLDLGFHRGDSTANVGNLQQRLLRTDRDFSAEDYEMLLELDEQAKSSQSNELEITLLLSQMPVTRVTASGSSRGSQCSICLENMAVGEEVRTLPCMHIFHRACIDKWVAMPGAVPKCPIDQEKIEFQCGLPK